MNENLNLVEILKDCPKGTKLYSTVFGEVKFTGIIANIAYKIEFEAEDGVVNSVTSNGKHRYEYNGECTLFPSKEQRDWSKFKQKKEKFDPKTLQPFDNVLVRDCSCDVWNCSILSHAQQKGSYNYACVNGANWKYCIPYNDDTKHLVDTTDDAPEFYRYWED